VSSQKGAARAQVVWAIEIAVGSAFLVGLCDGVIGYVRAAEGITAAFGVFAAGALVALLGVATGTAHAVIRLALDLIERLAPEEGDPALVERGRTAVCAAAMTMAMGTCAVVVAAVRVSLGIQVTTLATSVVIGAVAIALVASALLVAPLARLLEVVLARTGLPVRRVARAAIALVVAGVFGACIWFVVDSGEYLESNAVVVYAIASFTLAAPWTLGRIAVGRSVRLVVRGVDLVVVLALLAASVALSRSIPVRQVVASSWAADAIAGWLQGATDFDRDGASGFFGGADCASFDATRGPTIAEIPGNGRDEDCDGADGIAQQKVSSVPSISGLFPSKLIKRYNIVLVVIDAVRADRFFGYRRKVTPELHRLATEAIVFEKAFSQSSATRISFPSFLTGRWATRLDWERHGGEFQLGRRETMIQEVLQRKGYSTAIVANEWFSDHASRVPAYGSCRTIRKPAGGRTL
jgi:hypothetical protein